MDVVRFVLKADPDRRERLGAWLDARTLVDLQAAHFAMTEAPHPSLRDADAYRAADGAEEVARRVLGWTASERPPGTTVDKDHVDLRPW